VLLPVLHLLLQPLVRLHPLPSSHVLNDCLQVCSPSVDTLALSNSYSYATKKVDEPHESLGPNTSPTHGMISMHLAGEVVQQLDNKSNGYLSCSCTEGACSLTASACSPGHCKQTREHCKRMLTNITSATGKSSSSTILFGSRHGVLYQDQPCNLTGLNRNQTTGTTHFKNHTGSNGKSLTYISCVEESLMSAYFPHRSSSDA